MDLMWIPFLWTVDCHDEVEMMFTTFFRASAESYDRMANVVMAHYDGDKKSAVLIVTNYIDTVINDLSLRFQSSVGRWDEFPLEEEMKDYSDAESGIIRVMLPADELIQRFKESMAMKVSYKVSNGELVELLHPILSSEFGAGYSFDEQLKECPSLSKPGKLVR